MGEKRTLVRDAGRTGSAVGGSTPTRSSVASGRACSPLQRSWTLIGLELLMGVGALGGAAALVSTGAGMEAGLLSQTPFTTWMWPGVLLAVIVGVPMLVAAHGEWHRRSWALAASFLAGSLLMGWVTVQVALIGYQMWLQPLCFIAGLAITARASPRAVRRR